MFIPGNIPVDVHKKFGLQFGLVKSGWSEHWPFTQYGVFNEYVSHVVLKYGVGAPIQYFTENLFKQK